MQITDLKLSIINNTLDNFYVFYGPEYTVQRVYINKIAEVTKSDVQYIDSLSEISAYSGKSLFSIKKCFVSIDDDKLLKSDNIESDFAKIRQILGNNVLIMQYTKLDKRSKFYNFIQKANGVEFELLHSVVLSKHLMDQAEISRITAEKLAEICEFDYGRCLLELDKVKNSNEADKNKAFEQLLASGTISEPPGDKIFDFVDAVLGGKITTAFELFEKCKEIDEPALKLLSVLFTNIKHLLQVQACTGDVQATTGLQTWEIRKAQNFKGIYRNYELVDALELIQRLEVGIKRGQIDEDIAVEYALVNIF